MKYKFECAADGSMCVPMAEYAMNGVDGLLAVKLTQPGDDAWYFYHTDHLGSVVAVTDQIGNVVAKYTYDAWGNQTCTGSFCADNRYTYTAREWDEDTQLYYYRARWYDPKIQRFISEDPVFDVNRYAYVKNNPVKYIDPTGRAVPLAAVVVGVYTFIATDAAVNIEVESSDYSTYVATIPPPMEWDVGIPLPTPVGVQITVEVKKIFGVELLIPIKIEFIINNEIQELIEPGSTCQPET